MEYVRLGNSGLKVSKVILGCGLFGSSKWQGSPWILDEDDGIELLKAAYDAGINTWDTADAYSNGKSEIVIGKALKKHNIPRQKVVILTKIFSPVAEDDTRLPSVNDGPLVNQMGLSRKHVFHAVDKCLERLGTDYIDVLQVHRLDRETPPEEIMRALHEVVLSGKVRYIGASSMYAWEFARLQFIAQAHDWTQFISMQPLYNLLYREEEREMIPFCNATGVAVIPFSPLGRGLLARPRQQKDAPVTEGESEKQGESEQQGESEKQGESDQQGESEKQGESDQQGEQKDTPATEDEGKQPGQQQSMRKRLDKMQDAFAEESQMLIVDRVEKVAADKGVSMAKVSAAWLLHKGCWPIMGLNSEKKIKEAVRALKVKLTDEEVAYLESEYRPRAIHGM